MMCLMKKIQYFIAIAATVLLTATSCDKEDNPAPVVTVDQITISTGNGGQAAEVSLKQGETLRLKTAVSPALGTPAGSQLDDVFQPSTVPVPPFHVYCVAPAANAARATTAMTQFLMFHLHTA